VRLYTLLNDGEPMLTVNADSYPEAQKCPVRAYRRQRTDGATRNTSRDRRVAHDSEHSGAAETAALGEEDPDASRRRRGRVSSRGRSSIATCSHSCDGFSGRIWSLDDPRPDARG
jgi:hypothetical protein